MSDHDNGITGMMTEGYVYFSEVRCKNCGKRSLHPYGFNMEFNPCPHCGYAVGIREKHIEKQSTLGDWECQKTSKTQ